MRGSRVFGSQSESFAAFGCNLCGFLGAAGLSGAFRTRLPAHRGNAWLTGSWLAGAYWAWRPCSSGGARFARPRAVSRRETASVAILLGVWTKFHVASSRILKASGLSKLCRYSSSRWSSGNKYEKAHPFFRRGWNVNGVAGRLRGRGWKQRATVTAAATTAPGNVCGLCGCCDRFWQRVRQWRQI